MQSHTEKYYDAAIIGGGPAGLGSALALARKGLSVLLLEKNVIGQSSKTWLTFSYILEKYGLESCIRRRIPNIVFSSYLGNSYTMDGDFLVPIHEEQALLMLADQCREAGADLHQQEIFANYRLADEGTGVRIVSSKGCYRAGLLIDASGNTPMLESARRHKHEITNMGCLAFYLEDASGYKEDTMLLYDSFFPGSDYFWVVPFEDGKLMAGIFFFQTLNNANHAEKEAKLKLYMEARGISGRVYDIKMGNIPLGPQKYLSAPGCIYFGDSANTPLPSSGFSFSRCLEEAAPLADFAADYLNGKTSLESYKNYMIGPKIPAIEIHLIIMDMLSSFSDELLNKAIGKMNNLDPEFVISFLSGRDLSINFSVDALKAIFSTFSMSELLSLSLKQHYFKNLMQIPNLLPGMKKAEVWKQLRDFVKKMLRNKPA